MIILESNKLEFSDLLELSLEPQYVDVHHKIITVARSKNDLTTKKSYFQPALLLISVLIQGLNNN